MAFLSWMKPLTARRLPFRTAVRSPLRSMQAARCPARSERLQRRNTIRDSPALSAQEKETQPGEHACRLLRLQRLTNR